MKEVTELLFFTMGMSIGVLVVRNSYLKNENERLYVSIREMERKEKRKSNRNRFL